MSNLTKTDQELIRSVYHALRNCVVNSGYYPNVDNYDDSPEDFNRFKDDLQEIKDQKGFYIEVFSESSARFKGAKEAPRLVVCLGRSYPGTIGSNPNAVTRIAGSQNFQVTALPSQATNIQIEVYLIAATSEQHYTLNAIKDEVLGERSFVPKYNDLEGTPFLVYQTGFYDLDDPAEGVIEKGYIYTAPDVFRGPTKVITDNIKPIVDIKVDIEPTGDNVQVISDN